MKPRMVQVERLVQPYVVDGVIYGPSDEPLDVPELLASMLGLAPTPTDQRIDIDASNTSEPAELQRHIMALQGSLDTLTVQREQLSSQVKGLMTELEGLRAQLHRRGDSFPDDLHARLVSVKGVGELLADRIIPVITAPPSPPDLPSGGEGEGV